MTIEMNKPIVVINHFKEIASQLALKGALGENIVETQINNDMSKEFLLGNNIVIRYEFFPPKFSVSHKTSEDSKKAEQLMGKIINFASISDKIGSIGINYELFIKNNDTINLKDFLLKDNVAKEFSSLSTTLVLEIDSTLTLNIRIANAEINNENGICFDINFNNKISDSGSIETILHKDFLSIAKDKINTIFSV